MIAMAGAQMWQKGAVRRLTSADPDPRFHPRMPLDVDGEHLFDTPQTQKSYVQNRYFRNFH